MFRQFVNNAIRCIDDKLNTLRQARETDIDQYNQNINDLNHELSYHRRHFPTNFAAPSFITGLIHKCGVIATRLPHSRELPRQQTFLLTEHIEWMMGLLINDRRTQPKHLSISVYSASLLAKMGRLNGIVSVETINQLLTKLSKNPYATAQDISNAIYGLGELAKARNLAEKRLLTEHFIPLLDQLQLLARRHAIKPQDTSNAIYGLGELAKAGQLEGKLSVEHFIPLLNQLLACHDIVPQNICNAIYGFGELAKAGQLEGRLSVECLTLLLDQLLACHDITPQSISNTLYGFGELAKAGHLKEKFSVEYFIPLFNQLLARHDIIPQNICNAIYGFGELAKAGQLEGKLSVEHFIPLLDQLLARHDITPQSISNTIYGFGELAKAGLLEGSLLAERFIPLFDQLLAHHAILSRDTSNTIYGFGELAKAGQLEGKLSVEHFTPLLDQLLVRHDITPQNISNALYGLAGLAKAGQLEGKFSVERFIPLLGQLLACHDMAPQNISNAIYGFAGLAKAGQLEGKLSVEHFIPLLDQLLACHDITPQSISNTFYGLGEIAKMGHLTGRLPAERLISLLDQLLARHDATSQNISNTLYGFGELAKAGLLKGALLTGRFIPLLDQLLARHDIIPQNISNTLYGLGGLAKAGLLQENIHPTRVNLLLNKLENDRENNAESIHIGLIGLNLLAKSKVLMASPSTPISIAPLLAMMVAQVNRKQCPTVVARDVFSYAATLHQALVSLTDLMHHTNVLFSLAQQALSGNYLEPACASKLIHAFVCLNLYQDERFNALFSKVVDAVTIPLRTLPKHLQKQLKTDVATLQANHADDWYEQLTQGIDGLSTSTTKQTTQKSNQPSSQRTSSSRASISKTSVSRPSTTARTSRPKPPAQRFSASTPEVDEQKSTSAIFAAIYRKDRQGLLALLNLLSSSRPHLSSSSNRTYDGKRHTREEDAEGDDRRIRQRVSEERRRDDDSSQHQKKTNLVEWTDHSVRDFLHETPSHLFIELLKTRDVDYFILLIRACSQHTRYQLAIQHHLNLIIQHLPEKSLQTWVNALIHPLALYIDSDALISLLNALTLRIAASNDPTQKETLLKMQLQLLERGMAHHQYHRHVMSKLTAVQRLLHSKKITLWEDEGTEEDEEEEETLEETPDENKKIEKDDITEDETIEEDEYLPLQEDLRPTTRTTRLLPQHGMFKKAPPAPRHELEETIEGTLGDGNCLFNAVALSAKENTRLQDALIARLNRLISEEKAEFKAFNRDYPYSLPSEETAWRRLLSHILKQPSETLQKQLAPLLRYLAVNTLRGHYYLRDVPLFDATVLTHEVTQYQNNRDHRDDMNLLRHPFIQAKLNDIIDDAGTSAVEVPATFIAWFESEGKRRYFYEIMRPAAHASDYARWGSDVELDALALTLNTTMTLTKTGWNPHAVGRIGGVIRYRQVGWPSARVDDLVRLNIAEIKMMVNSEKRPQTYLRFTEEAHVILGLHAGEVTVPGVGTMEERIIAMVDGWRSEQNTQTALAYLNSKLTPDQTQQWIERGMINPGTNQFVSDGESQIDIGRLVTLARGFTESEVAKIRSLIQPVTSLATVHYSGGHWSHAPQACHSALFRH